MKPFIFTIKKIFYAFLGIFSPRSGLIPASLEFQRAIADAQRKNAKTGHRFYVIWNNQTLHLVALTYDGYQGRQDSYEYLRLRGAFPPTSRAKFKDSAFYYTSSKNGAPEMGKDERMVKLQLLRYRYFTC